MKNKFMIMLVFFSMFILSSCGWISNVIDNKKEIIFDKYGELEYIYERIHVYKNLKDELPFNDEIEYIINNSGNRGSVEPTFAANFYLMIDIVKQDGDYKMLLYNNVAKPLADEKKMFVLTDYMLPITIEQITEIMGNYNFNYNINNFIISFFKKDLEINADYYSNEISNYYYNLQDEGTIILEIYNYNSGDVIIGNSDLYIVGNYKDGVVFYPEDFDYEEILK